MNDGSTMNFTNYGVHAGQDVVFENSNVTFGAGEGRKDLEKGTSPCDAARHPLDVPPECIRSLAAGIVASREDLPDRTPDTGKWILEHEKYRIWSKHGGFLWIQGRPGSGKSMLLDFLNDAERQRQKTSGTTVLSFCYGNSGPNGGQWDSSANLFRSLCAQLLSAHRCLLPHFMEYTGFKDQTGIKHIWKTAKLWGWLQVAMTELLAPDRSCLLLIDALNDLAPETAAATAERLRTLAVENGERFRVCVSCHSHLRDGSKIDRPEDIIINIQDENQSDIETFALGCLTSARTDMQPDQDAAIAAALVERAEGVFQWLKWNARKARTLVDAGEDTDYILRHIRGYPQELYGIYEAILEGLDSELATAFRLFESLALNAGVMAAEDLRYAVCLDDGVKYESIEQLHQSPDFCASDQQLARRVERLSRGLVRSSQVQVHEKLWWPFFAGPAVASSSLLFVTFDHESVAEFMLTTGLNMLESRLDRSPLSKSQRHVKTAKRYIAFLQATEVVAFVQSRTVEETNMGFCVGLADYNPEKHQPPPPMTLAASLWRWHALAAEHEPSATSLMAQYLLTEDSSDLWTHLTKVNQIYARGNCSQHCERSSLLHVLSHCGLAGTLSRMFNDDQKEIRRDDFAAKQIESKDEGKRSPLFVAASSGSVECVRVLLSQGANVNNRSEQGLMPLHMAARLGHSEVVKLLLEQPSIDVDASNSEGERPIHFALLQSDLEVVQLLLPHTRLDVHSPQSALSMMGWGRWPINTLLGLALKASSVEVLELLLDRFGSNDIPQEPGQHSLLHLLSEHWWECMEEGRNDCAKKVAVILKKELFDVNWKGEKGQTPLSVAAQCGVQAIVRLLLRRHDVCVDEPDDEGASPFMHAVRADRPKIVQMFLDSGRVNVNFATETSGQTPLIWAARFGSAKTLSALMCHNHIELEQADSKGHTPFLWSIRAHRLFAASMLGKSEKVDLNVRDERWTPAVHHAIDSDDFHLVKLFLEAKEVDLGAVDGLGFPPLLHAVRRGKFPIVMSLIMRGQFEVVESLGAAMLMVQLAENEYRRNTSSEEREAVLEFMVCLIEGSQSQHGAVSAVQTVFSAPKDKVEFSDILASLRSARHYHKASRR